MSRLFVFLSVVLPVCCCSVKSFDHEAAAPFGADGFVTAYRAVSPGTVDPVSGRAFGVRLSGGGAVSVLVCDCGRFADASANPVFTDAGADPSECRCYRWLFRDGSDVWYFNFDSHEIQ